MHKHYKNDKLVFSFEDVGNAVNLYINGDNKHSIRENLRDIYDDYCKSKGQDFNHDEYGYAIHEAVDRLEYGHGVYLKLDNDKFNPAELFGNATEEQLYEAMLKNEFLHKGEHNFTDYEYIVCANLSADKCGRNIKVRDFAAFDSYGDFSKFKADDEVVIPLNNFEVIDPEPAIDSAFTKDSKNSVDTFLYPTENKDISETISILRKECDNIHDFINSHGAELYFEKTEDNVDVAIIDFGYGTQTQVFLETGHPFETFVEGMVNVEENMSNKYTLSAEIANEFNDRIGKNIDGKEPVLQLSGGVPVVECEMQDID